MKIKIQLAVLVTILTGLAFFFSQYFQTGTQLERGLVSVSGGRPLPDFTLVDQRNESFSLENVRGRPVILFFGYTNCPDVCPLAMRKISESLKALPRPGASFAVIFITVDPVRDVPERLTEWVARYYPDTIALTGDIEELRRVWSLYGAARSEDYEAVSSSGETYYVSHSAVIYVADRNHILRYILTPEMTVEEIRDTLSMVLRQ